MNFYKSNRKDTVKVKGNIREVNAYIHSNYGMMISKYWEQYGVNHERIANSMKRHILNRDIANFMIEKGFPIEIVNDEETAPIVNEELDLEVIESNVSLSEIQVDEALIHLFEQMSKINHAISYWLQIKKNGGQK